ncbi:MAG: DUF4234 domain-containing protein [Deltaproteobacteria bacterium]
MQPINANVDFGSQRLALGSERNPVVVVLLTLLTAGIYGLIHVYSLFEEARRYAQFKNPAILVTSGGAAVGFLFVPIFNVIWVIMLMFKIPGLVGKVREASGRGPSSTAMLGLLGLIPIIGGLTVLFITQLRLNAFWQDQRALIDQHVQSSQQRPVAARAA